MSWLEQQPRQTTAYEACSRCRGYGMVDGIDGPRSCPQCGGDCFVRARDNKGRFVSIPVNTENPTGDEGDFTAWITNGMDWPDDDPTQDNTDSPTP